MRQNGSKDAMDLPVRNVEAALPFYEQVMGVFFIVAPDGLCYCVGERQA